MKTLTAIPESRAFSSVSVVEYVRHSGMTGDYGVSQGIPPLLPEKWCVAAESFLDGIYGTVERRISCEAALAKTLPLPMMFCSTASASFPEADGMLDADEPHVHHYEVCDTLKEHAWQIGQRTWISHPSRALLETAQCSSDPRSAEWVLRAVVGRKFVAQDIIDAAYGADLKDGLRKVASLSTLADKEQDWHHCIREAATEMADEPIYLARTCLDMADAKEYARDENFGVIWTINPNELRATIP